MSKLIIFNKPFGVLSQFSDSKGRETLAQFIQIPNVYPIGRLDKNSEGLLLLTDDGALNNSIAHPNKKIWKTYIVQIEGDPSDYQLSPLKKGVMLKDGLTLPAKYKKIKIPSISERLPPVRYRKNIPTSWLEIQIYEGRNRQIRRMTALLGFPTLRLIRKKIGPWSINSIDPGRYKEIKVNKLK
tara:strand:+ start:73 stop:624 length:552 start_codon:yes stop_codon:yes gene_type:complete